MRRLPLCAPHLMRSLGRLQCYPPWAPGLRPEHKNLRPAPYFNRFVIADGAHIAGTTAGPETLAQTQPHFFKPAATVYLQAHHIGAQTFIGCYKGIAQRPSSQRLARQPVHIGELHRTEHDPRNPEISLRALCHAGAMFSPLAAHQPRRRHHAEIAFDCGRRKRLGRSAPLRIGRAARLRPQTVQDKRKTAVIAAALGFVAAAFFTQPTKFRRPAHRENIAGDRFDAAWFAGGLADGSSGFGQRRRAALVGLGLGWCSDSHKRQQYHRKQKFRAPHLMRNSVGPSSPPTRKLRIKCGAPGASKFKSVQNLAQYPLPVRFASAALPKYNQPPYPPFHG